MATRFPQRAESSNKTCTKDPNCNVSLVLCKNLNIPKKAGELCAAGTCVNSMTRYHEAFGPGLEFDTSLGYFKIVDSSLPTWVQSNSDEATLRLFQTDNYVDQVGQLIGSIFFTLLCIVGTKFAKRHLQARLA